MEHILRIRKFENLHILLWLIKDTSWMMEWRVLGICMMFPTIAVAVIIAIKTFRETEFFINLAIFFWITANSYWMCCEFFWHNDFKTYATIPFALGLISTLYFYYRKNREVVVVK